MTSPVPADPITLATAADFTKRYPSLAQDKDTVLLEEFAVEATDHIEDLVGRRLAPFQNQIWQDRLFGIDSQEYGQAESAPMDWAGSLGASYANALGSSQLVRHFWLDNFAPAHPELWTYDVQSITLYLTYGNSLSVPLENLRGPDVTDGHIWFPIGTFAPIGTRIEVIYSGGYTVAIPPALKRACLMQMAKFVIVDNEPQMRSGMNTDELDMQITSLLAPWARA